MLFPVLFLTLLLSAATAILSPCAAKANFIRRALHRFPTCPYSYSYSVEEVSRNPYSLRVGTNRNPAAFSLNFAQITSLRFMPVEIPEYRPIPFNTRAKWFPFTGVFFLNLSLRSHAVLAGVKPPVDTGATSVRTRMDLARYSPERGRRTSLSFGFGWLF